MEVAICPAEAVGAQIGSDDVAFVVDALRASSTVVTLLDAGARAVEPVTELRSENPEEGLAVGEENGERLPDADFGNSPTAVRAHGDRIDGERVRIKTTNGTACVDSVRHAGTVGMATLLNRQAVADAVANGRLEVPGRLWFVPADRRGDHAPEDHYTARRLRAAVLERLDGGESADQVGGGSAREIFLESETGDHLLDLGARDDVLFCARDDECSVVPVLRDGRFKPL